MRHDAKDPAGSCFWIKTTAKCWLTALCSVCSFADEMEKMYQSICCGLDWLGSVVYCLQSLYLYRSQEKSDWGFESYDIWIFTLKNTQKCALKWRGWWEKSVKMQGCRIGPVQCPKPLCYQAGPSVCFVLCLVLLKISLESGTGAWKKENLAAAFSKFRVSVEST